MTKRERGFFWSGGILFVITYRLINNILEAAKGVGDAPADMDTFFKSILCSLIIVACYSIVYYLVYFLVHLVNKII